MVLAYLVVRQSRQLRRLNSKLNRAEGHAMAATIFANALAERNVGIPCDDCGNMMHTDVAIEVLPRPDGGIYVGHSSHNRREDWGLMVDE